MRRPILFWLVLLACWVALIAASWKLLPRRRAPRVPLPSPEVAELTGGYDTVEQVGGPLVLHLKDGPAVRAGGVAAPAGEAESDAVEKRVRALVEESRGQVYVERPPAESPAPAGPVDASIWFPPPGAEGRGWFPDPKMRLLGAVLIQEGLARVDRRAYYMYKNELLMLEDDARRHRRGIWAGE